MKITKENILWSNKWITLKEAVYLDKKQKKRNWQFLTRTKDRRVVSVICFSEKNEVLLIKQERIPLQGKIEISFPAGLVDEGESLEQAALRELKEETGYNADIINVGPLCPKSSGMIDELSAIVYCRTNVSNYSDQELEDSEEIVSFWLSPENFFEFIKNQGNQGYYLSNELYAFMFGYNRPHI